MNFSDILKKSFLTSWEAQQNIPKSTMILSFAVVCLISFYIFIVYRRVTKSSFYSVNFAKTLVGVPLVTTGIVFAMQVNLLVSLGMVGALSIVRFRTAIKDPLDLLFLFWSISTGIVCGTGSYLISIFLAVVLTVVLLVIDLFPSKTDSLLLVINTDETALDSDILDVVKSNTKFYKVRTRVCKPNSKDFLIEIKSKNDSELVSKVFSMSGVNKVTTLSHDGEVRM